MKSSANWPWKDFVGGVSDPVISDGSSSWGKLIHHAASLAGCVLLAVISGCAMCQNPWDYCNAVIGPGGCPNCDFGARCGSAFAPIGHTPATTELGPTPAGATSEPAEPAEPAAPYNLPPDEGLEPFDGSGTPDF